MKLLDKITGLKNKVANYIDLSILQGAGVAFIIKLLGSGASFGLQVALAQLLSLQDYGSYTYIMAWIGMISGFASLGFNTSIIRFIPEYLKNQEYAKLKGVIITSILITFCCSLVFALVGLITISFWGAVENDYSKSTYFYIIGILLGLALITLFGSLEKGKKKMFMAHAPSQLFKHVFIGIGILLAWALNKSIDIQLALFITFIGVLLLLIWHLITFKNGLPQKAFSGKTVYKLIEWVKISLPLLLMGGFLMIINRTDIIMLGIFSTKAQVGIYNVAFKIATLTSFVLLAVNAIAAPTISELYHQDKMKELKQFARKMAHLIFWPTLILSTGLVVFAGFILSLFGQEFIEGKVLLFVLLLGQLINASVGSVGTFMNMTGFQNLSAKVFGVTAALNIIFNPIGIYYFDAIGAAIVTTLSTSLWNIWLFFLVKRKLGIKSIVY